MMIRKHLLILCVAIGFIPLTLNGQQDEPSVQHETPLFSGLIFKVSPLALLEIPQPSLQLAIEYPIAHTALALQHELGWLPPMASAGLFENGTKRHGLKVKTELRFYMNEHDPTHLKSMNHSTYIALEGMYRMRMVRNEEWHTVNNGSFSQWLTTDQYRQQVAFHFKYGKVIQPSGLNSLLIDSYVGLGLRRYFANTHRDSKELLGEPRISNSNYDFILPSLTLGFKLGFRVK